ncbi:MAG: hypothetical protein NXH82_04230 [Rhodobacteraceae bacterium]|nr:hypothetical protein [Paracoccaceae bacterium]
MPSDSFARTGIWVRRSGDTPVTRFQVLGERSSATNLVRRLIGRNSALQPVDVLGWKHGFAQMMAIPRDLAVICVVRAPEAWALSMHKRPWHTTPEMQRLPFDAFLRAPWHSVIDRPRYFSDASADPGQPLQQDRDPLTGRAFANLMALRRAKLAHLMTLPNRGGTCVVLRAEIAQSAPEQALRQILGALDVPGPSRFRPVLRRLGTRFKPAVADRPATPARMSLQDHAFAWGVLDRELERRLGYEPPPGIAG